MQHEKFHYQSLQEIQQMAEKCNAFLPLNEDVSPLFQPLQIGRHTVANRIALQPMEGTDGLENSSSVSSETWHFSTI